MKKILLAGLAVFTLTACKKDEEKKPSIIGVWKLDKELLVSGVDDIVLDTYTFDECEKKTTNEFKSNGQYVVTQYDWNQDHSDCEFDGTETMPYSYDESTKKITIDGQVGEVITLTENKLVMQAELGDENGDGVADYDRFI